MYGLNSAQGIRGPGHLLGDSQAPLLPCRAVNSRTALFQWGVADILYFRGVWPDCTISGVFCRTALFQGVLATIICIKVRGIWQNHLGQHSNVGTKHPLIIQGCTAGQRHSEVHGKPQDHQYCVPTFSKQGFMAVRRQPDAHGIAAPSYVTVSVINLSFRGT